MYKCDHFRFQIPSASSLIALDIPCVRGVVSGTFAATFICASEESLGESRLLRGGEWRRGGRLKSSVRYEGREAFDGGRGEGKACWGKRAGGEVKSGRVAGEVKRERNWREERQREIQGKEMKREKNEVWRLRVLSAWEVKREGKSNKKVVRDNEEWEKMRGKEEKINSGKKRVMKKVKGSRNKGEEDETKMKRVRWTQLAEDEEEKKKKSNKDVSKGGGRREISPRGGKKHNCPLCFLGRSSDTRGPDTQPLSLSFPPVLETREGQEKGKGGKGDALGLLRISRWQEGLG